MIYRISIGMILDFVKTSIMDKEDIDHIMEIEATQIHIFVKDISLYQLVLDKIHAIYHHITIITITFDASLDGDYSLSSTDIQFKHYILPDRYQLDKQLQATLAYKLNQYHVAFDEIEDFMAYLGIDQRQLRENLSYDNLYDNLSLKAFEWKDIFGKEPQVDLLKYLQESEKNIQSYFTNKQNTIITRFKEMIDDELKKYFDKYTYIYVLNPHNAYSLYQLISQISHINIQKLLTINNETSESFKEKYHETKASHSIFSHKEEKLDDLLQTLDMLISQRYEIHRFKAMKSIYNQILSYLKEIQMSYPLEAYDYHIPIDFYDDFIFRFMETREFTIYQEFVDYSYIYKQMFKQYDYDIIVSLYFLDNGIICEDMMENECEIYYV